MDRTQWLEQRRTGIGGSDISVLFGLNPWKSETELWLEKTGRQSVPQPDNERMYWGRRLEAVVASEFQQRTGHKVQRVEGLVRHPAWPHALATIDRAIIEPGRRAHLDRQQRLKGAAQLLEAKTGSEHTLDNWTDEQGQPDVPALYRAQVLWYLGICELESCHLAALIGGQHFILRVVQRDESLIESMLERAETWWQQHVIADTPPPPTTARDVQLLHGRGNGNLRDISGDLELLGLVDGLRETKARFDSVSTEFDALKQQAAIAIGGHDGLAANGQALCTWKAPKPAIKTDWQAVALALEPSAELLATHTRTEQGARRFLLR